MINENYDLNDDVNNVVGPVTNNAGPNSTQNSAISTVERQQGQVQQGGITQPQATTPSDSTIKSWNDITSAIANEGGFHFNQNGNLYYKQGDTLYNARPIAGGDFSVSVVPENEARGMIAKEIDASGLPVYARNNVYTLYDETVYGKKQLPDGSVEVYSLSPVEDEDVYNIAHTKGRSVPTAVDPFIDPVGLAASAATAGTYAGMAATGSTLSRIGSGILAGAKDIPTTAAQQTLSNPAKEWYNKNH